MAVNLDVPPAVLAMAKDGWDLAADTLDGAWRRLHQASVDGLSREVASAVEAFRETWVDEVKVTATTAQRNSDAFVEVGNDFQVSDRDQAELMRSLLPADYVDAPIAGRASTQVSPQGPPQVSR